MNPKETQWKTEVSQLFSKPTVDSHRALSIFAMKQQNVLHEGRAFTWRWCDPETGVEEGCVRATVRNSALHLSYRVRHGGGAWEDVSDIIVLSTTRPAKGGLRWWFVCPGCNSRRAKLYLLTHFRCRACFGLCYESQLETERDRVLRRFFKRRQLLGGFGGVYEPFPMKPKWMRWATYQRLRAMDQRGRMQIERHTFQLIDRLGIGDR